MKNQRIKPYLDRRERPKKKIPRRKLSWKKSAGVQPQRAISKEEDSTKLMKKALSAPSSFPPNFPSEDQHRVQVEADKHTPIAP